MTKAKQNLMNTNAQVANAFASVTLDEVIGLARGAAARQRAQQHGADQAEAGESGDQEDATMDDVSPLQENGPPIILVLAIGINIAQDFQRDNNNVLEDAVEPV